MGGHRSVGWAFQWKFWDYVLERNLKVHFEYTGSSFQCLSFMEFGIGVYSKFKNLDPLVFGLSAKNEKQLENRSRGWSGISPTPWGLPQVWTICYERIAGGGGVFFVRKSGWVPWFSPWQLPTLFWKILDPTAWFGCRIYSWVNNLIDKLCAHLDINFNIFRQTRSRNRWDAHETE